METPKIELKKCKQCGGEFPLSEFRNVGTRDGKLVALGYCRKCMVERRLQSRAKKKEKAAIAEQEKENTLRKLRLKDFTPRELLEELKERGYKWTKMEVTIVQEIDYNKI